MLKETLPSLSNDFHSALRKVERLVAESTGAYEALISQKINFVSEIAEANAYLESKDIILETIHLAQARVQKSDIEAIELVLTSLVNDVIPNNKDKVKVKTKAENNRLSLDIFLISEDGKDRNVFLDKGGSIQNIISAGLRLITLSRSKNRRFVVFDESDHAVKTEYVSKFVRLLNELAQALSIQVLYISHHSASCFEGASRVFELKMGDGNVASPNLKSDFAYSSTPKEFFTSLRIRNFRTHKDSIMHLCPYMNVVTGEHDIGKSTIVEAVMALMEGKTIASTLRDDMRMQSVEVKDSSGFSFEWVNDKDVKGGYQYVVADSAGDVISEHQGRGMPDWWHDFLFMKPVAGVNIHVSQQFKSHFLIGDDVSGQKRAEVMAFSKDLRVLAMMVANHTKQVKHYQGVIRSRKADVEEISEKVKSLLPYINLADDVSSLTALTSKVIANEQIAADIMQQFRQSERLEGKIADVMSLVDSHEKITFPSRLLKSFGALLSKSQSLEGIDREINALQMVEVLPDEYGSVDLATLETLSSFINTSLKLDRVKEQLNAIHGALSEGINTFDLAQLCHLSTSLQQSSEKEIQLQTEAESLEAQANSVVADMSNFLKNEIGSCPTCKRGFL